MKKILATLLGLLALPVLVYGATQITVPSAPGAGYALISTTTGAYVSTSTPWFPTLTFGSASGTRALNIQNSTANSFNLWSGPLLTSFHPQVQTDWSGLIGKNFFGSIDAVAGESGFFLSQTSASDANAFTSVGYVTAPGISAYGFNGFGNSVASTGNVPQIAGAFVSASNEGAATVDDATGLVIASNSNSGGGTIAANYGLQIADQTVGTKNWNIYSGAPYSSFNSYSKVGLDAKNAFSSLGSTPAFGVVMEDSSLTPTGAANIYAISTNPSGTKAYLAGTDYEVIHAGAGILDTASIMEVQVRNVGAGIINTSQAFHIYGADNSGGGSIGTQYGLLIDDQTAATNNYAIKTGLGWNSLGDNLGIGTTTPRWNLDLASSTRPQLALSDATLTSNPWTFRNAGGILYVATSSPSTFATSTKSALTLDANGQLTLPFYSGTGCAQFGAGGVLSNTGTACGSGGGASTDKFATSTNGLTIYPNSATAVVIGQTATTSLLDKLEVTGGVLFDSATTTNLFSTTASSTKLFSTNANLGFLIYGNATGTNATTTNHFSTTSSSTNLFGQLINGFGLSTCTGTNALTWTGGSFTCTAQPQGTVTSIGVATANGVSGSSSGGATPNLTITLGAITPTSVVASGLGHFGNLWSDASSTFQNFTALQSTSTNATTTNLFSTTASSTNLFSSFLGIASSTPTTALSVGAGAITVAEYQPATTTSITVNWKNGNQQLIRSGTGATTIAFSNFIAGQHLTLILCMPATTGGAVTFSGVIWPGGTAPTTTTTASKCDIMTFLATNSTSSIPSIFGGFNQNY